MTTFRILIVDDDTIYRDRLARSLRDAGHEVATAGDCPNGLSVARDFNPTAAVLDLRMPGMNGIDCLKGLVADYPGIKVVMLTGYGSIANAIEAVRAGAADYLTKPADAEQILAVLGGEAVEEGNPANVPSLERLEWEHIQRVLHDCHGNISRTAEALGMHRRSLQRKLQKYPPNQ